MMNEEKKMVTNLSSCANLVIRKVNELLQQQGMDARISKLSIYPQEKATVINCLSNNDEYSLRVSCAEEIDEGMIVDALVKSEKIQEAVKNRTVDTEYVAKNIFPFAIPKRDFRMYSELKVVSANYLNIRVGLKIVFPIKDKDSTISILVKQSDLNICGISVKRAFELAIRNAGQNAIIEDLFSVVRNMGMPIPENVDEEMPLVITNKNSSYGFTGIMSREVREEIVKRFHGKKIAVVPSSIHEAMAFPYEDNSQLVYLFHMVCEINKTTVDPHDYLSDSIYAINTTNDGYPLELILELNN